MSAQFQPLGQAVAGGVFPGVLLGALTITLDIVAVPFVPFVPELTAKSIKLV